MDNIRAILDEIDINNLLKIFDIQIAIGIFIIFVVFRSLFSRLIIKSFYAITKNDKSSRESDMYKPLNIFFILLGFWFAINILPISTEIKYYINLILKIIGIYFIFRAITLLIHEDSIF